MSTSVLTFLFYIIYVAAEIVTNIWLSEWSDDEPKTNGGQDIALRNLRLGVFAILGAGQGNMVYCNLYQNIQNNLFCYYSKYSYILK